METTIEQHDCLSESCIFELLDKDQIISEDNHGQKVKRTRMTGIIQKGDAFNINRRLYSEPILYEAVEAIQDDITKRRVLGELGHPHHVDPKLAHKINIERVSHLMTKVWMEGKKVYGELEVLEDMPYGAILKALIDSDVTIGISSRGLGKVKSIVLRENYERGLEVQPGYRFVTWDVVIDPSVQEAELSIMESINKKLSYFDASTQIADAFKKFLRHRIK